MIIIFLRLREGVNMCSHEQVKFGIFTDMHVDIMHDCLSRTTAFLDDCLREQVDFIIQLGDYCYPDENRYVLCKPENIPVNVANALMEKPSEDKEKIFRLFKEYPAPKYHVLGNHDLDFCSKEEVVKYLGCQNTYYSFDCKLFHFVVLDCNFFMAGNRYHSYDHGNYFDYTHEEAPFLDENQLYWLTKDLEQTEKPIIIFSHQSLKNGLYGIKNANKFRRILAEQRKNGKRILMCINGHNHIDNLVKVDDVLYFNLNSISNAWLGEEYAASRYGFGIDNKYPSISYTVPYKEPIYAIITMDDSYLEVKGKESSFVGKSPYELGFPLSRTETRITPKVSSFKIKV